MPEYSPSSGDGRASPIHRFARGIARGLRKLSSRRGSPNPIESRSGTEASDDVKASSIEASDTVAAPITPKLPRAASTPRQRAPQPGLAPEAESELGLPPKGVAGAENSVFSSVSVQQQLMMQQYYLSMAQWQASSDNQQAGTAPESATAEHKPFAAGATPQFSMSDFMQWQAAMMKYQSQMQQPEQTGGKARKVAAGLPSVTDHA